MAEHAKTQNLLNQPRITLIARFVCVWGQHLCFDGTSTTGSSSPEVIKEPNLYQKPYSNVLVPYLGDDLYVVVLHKRGIWSPHSNQIFQFC